MWLATLAGVIPCADILHHTRDRKQCADGRAGVLSPVGCPTDTGTCPWEMLRCATQADYRSDDPMWLYIEAPYMPSIHPSIHPCMHSYMRMHTPIWLYGAIRQGHIPSFVRSLFILSLSHSSLVLIPHACLWLRVEAA